MEVKLLMLSTRLPSRPLRTLLIHPAIVDIASGTTGGAIRLARPRSPPNRYITPHIDIVSGVKSCGAIIRSRSISIILHHPLSRPPKHQSMQAVTSSLRRTAIRTRIPHIFRKQPARTLTTPTPTAKMTTGTFRYADPATINRSSTPFIKSWSKVDVDYSSFSRVSVSKSVHDLRSALQSSPSDFGVDVSGFALYNHPAQETSFTDERAIWSGYYAEVEALLREKLPGIKRVEIFDHTIRRNNDSAARRPVQQVHVDQTPAAAATRVRRHVTPAEEAEKLLKGRYQIINVWRPISHPATDFPLAFIDWRSTSPGDLVPIDLLYPKRSESEDDGDDRGKEIAPLPETYPSTEGYEVKGETYGVVPSEGHKFYYVKDMKPEEVVLIKCFDSWGEGLEEPWGRGRKGVAGWTPHTAFVDPATPEGTPGRESIEVRCLVFYEDEE